MRTGTLMLTALLAACGPSVQNNGNGGEIEIELEPAAVVAGATIEMTLENDSPSEIGYNLCTSTLERRVDEGWEGIPSERVCTMELRTVEAGGEATYSYELPADLRPGEYRFLASVHRMDDEARLSIWSESFHVR